MRFILVALGLMVALPAAQAQTRWEGHRIPFTNIPNQAGRTICWVQLFSASHAGGDAPLVLHVRSLSRLNMEFTGEVTVNNQGRAKVTPFSSGVIRAGQPFDISVANVFPDQTRTGDLALQISTCREF